MAPVDVELMIKNLNDRVTSVEQILPTLATKQDLEAFATKEDLKALATKEDLRAFATKVDLEAMRTELRTEMKTLFTDARHYALVLHEDLKSQLGLIAEHLADVRSRLPPRRS